MSAETVTNIAEALRLLKAVGKTALVLDISEVEKIPLPGFVRCVPPGVLQQENEQKNGNVEVAILSRLLGSNRGSYSMPDGVLLILGEKSVADAFEKFAQDHVL